MEKNYNKALFDDASEVIDLIKDLALEKGTTEEQAAKAVEIAVLTQIEQKLDYIDDAILNFTLD